MVTETDAKPGTAIAEAPGTLGTEAPEPQAPAGEGAKPEPQVDLKAALEAERAARVKLEGDLKALKGARLKQEERDAKMEEILDELKTTRSTISILAKAQASGETENVGAEIEQAQQHAGQAVSERRFAAVRASLLDQFYDAVNAEDGKPLLDIQNAPELEEARRMLIAGEKAGDKFEMAQAVALVLKAARHEERKRGKQAVTASAKAAAEKAEKALAAADVNNLDTGTPTGGGKMPDETRLQGYAAGDLSSPADHAWAAKYLKNL